MTNKEYQRLINKYYKSISFRYVIDTKPSGDKFIRSPHRDDDPKKIKTFEIVTSRAIKAIEPYFIEWALKTKVHTGSSFARFYRRKNRAVLILSENQHLNFLLSKKPFKKYF